jgi:hypothetical protein
MRFDLPRPRPGSGNSIVDLIQRLIVLRIAYTVASLAGLLVAAAAAEAVFSARTAPGSTAPLGNTPQAAALKLASTLLTLLALALLCAVHFYRFQLNRARHVVMPLLHFYETPQAARLVLEFAFMAVHCPVGCYANWVTVNAGGSRAVYDADSLLTLIMLVPRLRPLVQLVLLRLSSLLSLRTLVVSSVTGFQFTEDLALRTIFKRHPLTTSLTSYFALVLVFSYALHATERVVCESEDYAATAACGTNTARLSIWWNA